MLELIIYSDNMLSKTFDENIINDVIKDIGINNKLFKYPDLSYYKSLEKRRSYILSNDEVSKILNYKFEEREEKIVKLLLDLIENKVIFINNEIKEFFKLIKGFRDYGRLDEIYEYLNDNKEELFVATKLEIRLKQNGVF